ncbi:acyl carrier protein [Sorangium sp. So ce429]
MEDIEAPLRNYLNEEFMFRHPDVTLHEQLDLIREGIIDSLGIVRLTHFLEERFDIVLDPSEIVAANFQTLSAIHRLVATKLRARSV